LLLDLLKATGVLGHGPDGGTPLTVVGHGTTLDWPPPEHIAHDGLRRYAVTEYQALTDAWVMVSQSLANENGGGGYGDSGGPTFWTDPLTNEEVLIGTTSWGDRNCVAIGFQYRTDICHEFVTSARKRIAFRCVGGRPTRPTPRVTIAAGVVIMMTSCPLRGVDRSHYLGCVCGPHEKVVRVTRTRPGCRTQSRSTPLLG
jgi:hypothetical protein